MQNQRGVSGTPEETQKFAIIVVVMVSLPMVLLLMVVII